jgi:hypothetical protein
VQLASCWPHVRRRFYELAAAGPAPIASEAFERIAGLYAVEGDNPAAECTIARGGFQGIFFGDYFGYNILQWLGARFTIAALTEVTGIGA